MIINKNSIFFTITVSFIISIILLIVSFVILLSHEYKVKERHLFKRYVPILKMVNRQISYGITPTFIDNLKELDFVIFKNINKINAITYNPKTRVLTQKINKKYKNIFRILQLNKVNYIYLKRKGLTLLIKDNNTSTNSSEIYIILIFVILLIMIVLVYIITLRKLIPIKILKDKVKTLGDENFDFECCNSNGKDEVSQLGHEFMETAKKLKDLKEARNIFIRNIMHELKTPITKGRFLTQLEHNKENNEKLKSVFFRLESLINEFASIEELISSCKNIEKKFYFIEDIVDNAKDILMIDDDLVIENYENKKIEVNFKLFSIAVKNLLDNGLKYSFDKKIVISNEDDDIIFENKGEKLEYPLEEYFEPFFSNKDKQKDSFGLGLYIVHNILKANNYTLMYEYYEGTNKFICKKSINLSKK